ncbi:MAG TPA: hypothetical protein VNL73_11500 [Verrucomicrobiae bacterium]|nr:hypothetical protein [Verrucomicrobiae bacterium]
MGLSKKIYLGLAACAALFLYQILSFNVLQDDAFISFRYVQNLLNGHGLVFNVGARVEGYTNFFWIILMALLSKIGLPLVETARVGGALAAFAVIGLSLHTAEKYYPKRGSVWILAVPLLLAANGSNAFWAAAGLETGLFALLAALAGIFYLASPGLSLLFVTLAALTRPEGALLAFLFGVAGIALRERSVKQTLGWWALLALALIPYAVFKWFYFGSLFPSPFFAKTGFSVEYWKSGLEYFFIFLRRYALYGAALLLPVLFWKILHPFSRFSFLVFAGYTLYIISVGGDVLYAGRFFVPALFFFYFPLADAVYRLSEFLPLSKKLSFGIMTLVLAACTYFVPLGNLQTSAAGERGLIARMSGFGRFFAQDEKAKSFSLSSIGAFSYYVGEKPVYDMLGLTEPEVARNPEEIEGLVSTWKEKRFNASYILSKKPDVIFFPTRFKPASPAEKALLLYPAFRQNYRLEIFFGGVLLPYYYRFQDRPVPNARDQFPAFVELFNQSVDALEARQFPAALDGLKRILAQGPNDFPVLYMLTGYAHHALGQPDSAEAYLKKALELDGGGSFSRFYYRNFLYNEGRFAEARFQDSLLLESLPGASLFLSPISGQ